MEWRRIVEDELSGRSESCLNSRQAPDYADNPAYFYFFSNVSSVLRRRVWQDIPFPEVAFAEDQLWAKRVLEAGYQTVYRADSLVYHSHAYGPWMNLRRHFDHAQAVGDFQQAPRLSGWSLLPHGLARRPPGPVLLALAQQTGAFARGTPLGESGPGLAFCGTLGYLAGRTKASAGSVCGPSAFAPREYQTAVNMRILQVAHGYPPREWGGAELVTATLARALVERGHQRDGLRPDGRARSGRVFGPTG